MALGPYVFNSADASLAIPALPEGLRWVNQEAQGKIATQPGPNYLAKPEENETGISTKSSYCSVQHIEHITRKY